MPQHDWMTSSRDHRQKAIHDWCRAAFGDEHATSLPQRGVRLLEEAIELYQATGASREMAHRLVDFIFGRPVGTIGQEVGGVSVCLLALSAAAGLSTDDLERMEVDRVLAKPIEEFKARNAAKNAAGFNTTGGKDVPPRRVTPEQLPPADTIVDYPDGSFMPLFYHWATEGEDFCFAARMAGFEATRLAMDEDLGEDHELCVAHFEYGVDASTTLRRWNPPDIGPGWALSGKYDSEDGPMALYLRPNA